MIDRKVRVLGIGFKDCGVHRMVQIAMKGGLVVAPSGPCLANDFQRNNDYREAILSADCIMADSGAMVLWVRLFRGKRLKRVSGLNFLERFLERPEVKEAGAVFWIHPSEEERFRNEGWLKKQGFYTGEDNRYVAPLYPSEGLRDSRLWEHLSQVKPKVVVINLGGGVQERLGYWLKQAYAERGMPCPSILCTGAAIAFLSGNQVAIPRWADRLYLGWFFRCLANPRKFIPRYLSAIPLAALVLRYGEKLPLLRK